MKKTRKLRTKVVMNSTGDSAVCGKGFLEAKPAIQVSNKASILKVDFRQISAAQFTAQHAAQVIAQHAARVYLQTDLAVAV